MAKRNTPNPKETETKAASEEATVVDREMNASPVSDHEAPSGEQQAQGAITMTPDQLQQLIAGAVSQALDERDRDAVSRETSRFSPRERESQQDMRTRAADETSRMERRSMDYYSPPEQLEVPQDPDYHFRWVAEFVNGSPTPNNVQKRLREGYVRVRMDELPDDFLVDEDDRGDGFARTSGLILMRVPRQVKDRRDAYWLGKSQQRLDSADQLQGIRRDDQVREDRGSRSLTGIDAQRALTAMSQ